MCDYWVNIIKGYIVFWGYETNLILICIIVNQSKN